MPIGKNTAQDIAFAYREIETAENLLAEINKSLEKREDVDIRDAFGRRQNGLQLGVPTGPGSQRLFDVPWTLARPIIEAHIAKQRAIVEALSQKAANEIGLTP